MSNNIATLQIMSILNAAHIDTENPADNVFTISPSDVDDARLILASQPHFLYFLDRGVKVRKYVLSDDASADVTKETYGYRLVRSDVTFSTDGWEVWTKSTDTELFSGKTGPSFEGDAYLTSKAFVRDYERWWGAPLRDGATSQETADYNSMVENAGFVIHQSLNIEHRKLLGSPVGTRVTYSWEGVAGDLKLQYPAGCYKGPISTNDLPAGDWGWNVPTRRYGKLVSERVMVAGPPCVDYGEILPTFEWYSGHVSTVAARMRAASAYAATLRVTDYEEFDARLQEMVDTDSSLVVFRNRDLVDPLALWPTAQSLNLTLDKVVPEGELITAASIAAGKEEWRSKKWMLSVVNATGADAGISELVAGETTVIVKPSGYTSAHVTTAASFTTDVPFSALDTVLTNLYAAGRVIEFQDNTWTTNPLFDSTQWQAFVSMSPSDAPAERDVTYGSEDFNSLLGEAVVARLVTPAYVSSREELTVVPFLCPDFIWAGYARG